MSIDWNWGIFLQQAPFGNTTYLGWIWSGFQVTIALSICAWIIAFLVGSFFGILRTVPNRFLSGLGTLYVELFRNVPLIVQFFTWYLVIPELLPEKIGMWFKAELDPNIQFFLSSMLCLGLFTAARVCEQVRAAIQSLPRGQKNAALAMGLTLPQAYRYVLLPNAYRVIVPPMTSEMMNLVKNSALIIISDTLVAILAGMAVLPAAFALGGSGAELAGPKLLFITLQDVFNAMGTAGPLFGVLFYLLVSLAAITSAIALTEVMVTFFLDHAALKGHKPNRSRIVGLVCLAVMAVSTLVAVDGLGSNGLWIPFHQTGRNLAASWLDFMDFISEGVAMPLGALIMTLLVGWKIGPGTIRDEVMERDNPFSPRLYRFYIFIRVIAPIGMAFILYGQLAQFFTVA